MRPDAVSLKARDDGSDDTGGALAVIRIGEGRDDTCTMDWIDIATVAKSPEAARKLGYEKPPGHDCPEFKDGEAEASGSKER